MKGFELSLAACTLCRTRAKLRTTRAARSVAAPGRAASTATIRRPWRCGSPGPASSRHPARSPQRADAALQHRALAQGDRARLRPEPRRHPPGDALVRLRPVPRRVLLRAQDDAHLSRGARGSRSRRSRPTTTARVPDGTASTTGARRDRRRGPQGPAPGVRDVEPGHARAQRASPAPTATCPTCARARSKVSDHWVRSPLLNVNRACQTCHRFPEAELPARVDAHPGPHHDLLAARRRRH